MGLLYLRCRQKFQTATSHGRLLFLPRCQRRRRFDVRAVLSHAAAHREKQRHLDRGLSEGKHSVMDSNTDLLWSLKYISRVIRTKASELRSSRVLEIASPPLTMHSQNATSITADSSWKSQQRSATFRV